MKTAISIPDPVFDAAELLAKRLGMSRSELYATAVARFIDAFDASAITKALNELYSDLDEAVDPVLAKMQFQSLSEEDW